MVHVLYLGTPLFTGNSGGGPPTLGGQLFAFDLVFAAAFDHAREAAVEMKAAMATAGTAASILASDQTELDMTEGHVVVQNPTISFQRAKQWYVSVNTALLTHDYLAGMFLWRARVFNVICAIGNTVIASAIFTAVGADGSSYKTWVEIAAGLISVVVAVLHAIKLQLDYDSRAEKHAGARRGYARTKHAMEMLLHIRQCRMVTATGETHPDWSKVIEAWEAVEADAPAISLELKRKVRIKQTKELAEVEASMQNLRPVVEEGSIQKGRNTEEEMDYEGGEEY